MAGFFRLPNRRQRHLLPVDMLEWVSEDDIVHLVIDVIEGMDLRRLEKRYQVGGAGAPPFSPEMMLTVLVYAYANGYTSSRKIERLCIRDAGFRVIVGEETPDHASIARFRRKHLEDIQVLFTSVLALCRKAGLVRFGLLALDGTKVKGNAAIESNRTAKALGEEVRELLSKAEEEDAREDKLYGGKRGDELPEGMKSRSDRLLRLARCREQLEKEAAAVARKQTAKVADRKREEKETGKKRRGRKPKKASDEVDPGAKANTTDPDSRIMKTRRGWIQGYNAQAVVTADQIIVAAEITQDHNDVKQLDPMLALAWANLDLAGEDDPELGVVLADAGYWSENNASRATEDCELLIATRKDWKQRKELKERNPPRGRMPKNITVRGRMERKLLTKRGKSLYRMRGQTVEPVFGQMKETQGADRFRMRGLSNCDGEWKLHAAVHNLKKLHALYMRNAKMPEGKRGLPQ